MDVALLQTLFLNLALASILFSFAKWFIKYDMKWWVRVQRSKTCVSTYKKWVYLQIKLPRDVYKTPAAMETVLLTLNQTLGHRAMPTIPKFEFTPFHKKEKDKKKFSFRLFTYYDNGGAEKQFYQWLIELKKNFFLKYQSGSLRGWSSLEILSDEGNISFIVVTKSNNSVIFKQYAYSQFPGVEINEVSDPLDKFHYTNQKTGKSELYVGRYSLDKDSDHLPIKTYVDYGLDKEMVKDEFKIDPLVVLLESMSLAGKGEMYWFQLVIRPTIYKKGDDPSLHPYHWVDETKSQINKILGYEDVEVEIDDGHGNKKKEKKINLRRGPLNLTPTEKHQVEIMQRNIEKPGFDVVCRMFAWIDKGVHPKGLSVPKNVMTVVNATKPFGKPGYNSLGFDTITEDVDYPFTDPTGRWTEGKRMWTWRNAKLRAAFYQEAFNVEFEWKFAKMIIERWWTGTSWDWAKSLIGETKEYWYEDLGTFPHKGQSGKPNEASGFILNTEELATLWHFPGRNFGNTESKVGSVKADPPSNLPI